MSKELFHYGTPHVGYTPHSGRYKFGSGDKPYQHPYEERMNFISKDRSLMDEKLSEKERANAFGLTVNEYRKKKSIVLAEERAATVTRVQRLKAKGYTNAKIGEIIGGDTPVPESTIRNYLKTSEKSRKEKIDNIADVLENKVKKGEIVDVGSGSNLYLNVTKTTFDTALKSLQDKGYVVSTIDVEQPNAPGKYTTVKYLAPKGTTKKDAWENRGDIKTITEYSPDKGKTIMTTQKPTSLSSDRVKIVYSEDGGTERDGMVGIRPGVKDLTLGKGSYAQVRIAVDNKYFIKGMAVYQDDIPKGYDVVVYSNKSKEKGIEKALKPLKDDPDNPFGALIKAGGQDFYSDKNGNYVKTGADSYELDLNNKIEGKRYSLSPINRIKEEGDWDAYRRSLPAQFLSKQPLQLIKKQLDLTYKTKLDEYEEIKNLDNAVVKQKLLNDFAEGIDRTAKHLEAAALPRQNSRVLIPVPELKENEIYAPTYKNGEKLALIRFPHAGTFEIPIVTVNNRNKYAKELIENATDAVGINKSVAERMSGADFDGDSVLTIPISDKVKITSTKPLKDLEKFDPTEAYPKYEGMKVISPDQKQKEMGIVTNLITDMSLQNPTPEEMARAVKHSMVVIDAEKHELNWKQSEKDNGIEALKQKYQINPDKKKGYGGSSTLLSRLGNATIKVDEITPMKLNSEGKWVKAYKPDSETGEWIFKESGRTYNKLVKKNGEPVLDKNGNKIFETKKYKSTVSPLDLVEDANELSSGTAQETAYANYINKMRSLANSARKESLSLEMPKRDPIAAKNYEEEVESLNSKLNIALRNKPLERQAQLKSNVKIENLKDTNPELFTKDKKDKLKKTRNKILTETRLEVGAGKESIKITEKEWEAIQAKAISPTTLVKILQNSDMDYVRKLATPRQREELTDAKISRIRALSNNGFSIAEIAEMIGRSPSTVSKYLK